ncbi:MAG: hypothetical protein IT169_01090 [Bryobacterales bacterium]|nr:hypothetical protein [Bryobacterales bacterium]
MSEASYRGTAENFLAAPVVTLERRRITAPAVASIPQATEHYVVNLSESEPLTYTYISIWPGGVPRAEIEQGWRAVYARMIEEYAARGYGN